MVERFFYTEDVGGSIPLAPTEIIITTLAVVIIIFAPRESNPLGPPFLRRRTADYKKWHVSTRRGEAIPLAPTNLTNAHSLKNSEYRLILSKQSGGGGRRDVASFYFSNPIYVVVREYETMDSLEDDVCSLTADEWLELLRSALWNWCCSN